LLELGAPLRRSVRRHQRRALTIDPQDAELQDILLCIQNRLDSLGPRPDAHGGSSYYLRTPQEMRALFGHVPGAIENTLAIAERCTVDLGFKGYRLPAFAVPQGETPAGTCSACAWKDWTGASARARPIRRSTLASSTNWA